MPTRNRQQPGNLPPELTNFIGRRRELGEVKLLLAQSRLVTLTGVGGTGKTRLALRVAGEVQRAFPDGAWFVDLAEVREPSLLAQEVQDPEVLAYLVMSALGLRQQGGGSPVQQLPEYLAGRQALLVLDNCEHVIAACAVMVDALVRACPTLRVLATSRELLAVGGEMLYQVPPLRTPSPNARLMLADLAGYESVVLFVARAQAAVPGFALSVECRDAVAELCHRLDGLPLAIELAAARVRTLSPQQILERLADRFRLLSRGSRAGPARQQTLRACVEWSFDLCSKPERLLWARLSVFVGGFELDGVEGVCTDDALPADDLLDVLSGLMDKSILDRADEGQVARYRMLETLRDYGREQLRDAGEQEVSPRRHRDWYQQLVARARAEWVSDSQVSWLARLRREHPNLRAAIESCLTSSDEAETALRIAVTVPLYYWLGVAPSLFGEGRHWLNRALRQATSPTILRARALVLASQMALIQGDVDSGTLLLEQGENLARQLGAPGALAHAAMIEA